MSEAKVTAAQLKWLGLFQLCGWDTYVWRPADIDTVILRAKGTLQELPAMR